jgi:hypothetical protein
LDVAFQA